MATLAATFYLANARQAVALAVVLVAGGALFLWLLQRFQRAAAEQRQATARADLAADELARLQRQWPLRAADGAAFKNAAHPYAADLDLFGSRSLYQWLNRTTTPEGAARLADWLLTPADPPTVAARQEAAQALAEVPDWWQTFVVAGKPAPEASRVSPPVLPHSVADTAFGRVWRYFGPLAATAAVVAAFLTGWWWLPFLLVGLNVWLLVRLAEPLRTVMQVGVPAQLRQYAAKFKQIEQASWKAPLGQALQKAVTTPMPASAAIRRLGDIIAWVDARANLFYGLLNALWLLDFWTWHRLRRWHAQHDAHLTTWLDAMATTDALVSLGATAFAQPEWTWPKVKEGALSLRAEQMGHPLLPPDSRVSNDWTLEDPGRVMLITGANMSGKSTFQRTVGVNTVLALAGAPACATAFALTPVQVFTSMRTQDSLDEGLSSFYAELARLRQLLEMLCERPATAPPVLYLLDEILKGTNSADRHTGSVALIHQLRRTNAAGLISTHDLSLGALADSTDGAVVNYSFNSDVVGDEIRFDYHLTPGVCRSFNAAKLMEKMGIDIPAVTEKP